jgi:hypothetical protein
MDDALGVAVGGADGLAARGPAGGEFGLGVAGFVAGVAQEDGAEDGRGVCVGAEAGVGAQFAGGVPQAIFQFAVVKGHRETSRAGSGWVGLDASYYSTFMLAFSIPLSGYSNSQFDRRTKVQRTWLISKGPFDVSSSALKGAKCVAPKAKRLY